MDGTSDGPEPLPMGGVNKFLCFGGGVGGALTFAFSPVEWSQSTIVEIYSLNALFLMWVFLLSYRWMRKPSDKILWLTAFVFGLGLTNYQVLLFAIVPLALIILLKNIGMFRDVFIYLVPVLLTWQILQIGQLGRADGTMQSDVINKHLPVGLKASDWGQCHFLRDGRRYFERLPEPSAFTDACPHTWLLVVGLVLLVMGIVVAAVLISRQRKRAATWAVGLGGGLGVFVLLLSTLITSRNVWEGVTAPVAPLIEPVWYVVIAAFAAASAVLAVIASLQADDVRTTKGRSVPFLAVSVVCAVIAVILAFSAAPEADSLYYNGEQYPWGKSTAIFFLLIVLLFALCAFTKKGLCFAIPAAGVQIAAFVLLRHGAMNGLTHPASWWFCWPVAWNFVLLALAWVTLPNGRSVAGAAFFTQLGVSFYVYMPIVSDLRNPPMNWGYPRTWEGFKHALMRGQYEAIAFKLPTWGGIASYFKDVMVQFTDVLALLALVPFAVGHWIVKKESRKAFWSWMVPAVACFLLMSVLLIGLANVKGDVQDGFIQKVKFISSHAMIALWIGYGLVLSVVAALKLSACEATGRRSFWIRYVQAVGVALVALLAFWALGALADHLQSKEVRAWICNATTLVSLTGKCLGLIALLILLLTVVASFFRRFRRGERAFAVVMMLLAILVAGVTPIVQNYCDDRLVFELGGAEQNGHTFGWQFGAYQLEGAKAINDQLVADEEPLPDPTWPPPMDKFSIFFGGTDPGRFVPTYMIYSALYRPDVYLITQNALADDTYMSVERDLYGDEIWIPSKEDSAEAFNKYVSDAQADPARYQQLLENGTLRLENGRVQVTGALAVMDINGILTKMMHDHDRLRHSFYVEESYVIQWMYPYLSPHGLIMKINADPTPYDAKRAAKDMDFWDWYLRRLLDDPMYRRDFAGQKSFSKLRAAIAGLYQKQNRYREASQAFREAVALYPASPEATFRYAQEVLMPFRRWDATLELLDNTDRIDPHNQRTQNLRDYIVRYRTLTADISRLEGKLRAKQPLTSEETFLLISRYFEAGRVAEAAQLARGLADGMADPDGLRMLATIFLDAHADADAEKTLNRYLKARPRGDAVAWADLAKLQFRAGRRTAALGSFQMAVRENAGLIQGRLARDPELQQVYAEWAKQQRRPQQQIPGLW